MKNKSIKVKTLAVVLLMTMGFFSGLEAKASFINSGAKILRVEYLGSELSKDRNNPTVLDTKDEYYILFNLVGNPACGALGDINDMNINGFFNDIDGGSGFSAFDASGRATIFFGVHNSMYVVNDVFEVYWNISSAIKRNGDETTFGIIPNSDSPKYYVTYSHGEIDHQVPQGAVPTIVRAELNDVELSRDANNPTIIPYFNKIKLVGNSVCSSKTVSVQTWHNGFWTGTGHILNFNSYAIAFSFQGVAYEFTGNNGEPLYNETVTLEFAIHDEETHEAITKSPVYYVQYLDRDSAYVDFVGNGVFQRITLTGNQLIVEVKQGYIFQGCDILLKDKTENKEYELGIWLENNDCTGVLTNRIVYSNLPLKKNNIYELTIPEASVQYKIGIDHNDLNNLKYNREYKTELLMEGAVSFIDVKESDWAYPYVKQSTEKRIIDGYADGTFKPNGQVTRSEFAKIMTLSFQIPLVHSATQTFVDVDKNSWDHIYVETAKPYLTGYYDGNSYYFRGSSPAVREDMVVALVKAAGLENQNVDLNELAETFSDHALISTNLRKFVLIAYKNQLIDGYPDGTFGPGNTITRAETVALLTKVYASDAMEKVTF